MAEIGWREASIPRPESCRDWGSVEGQKRRLWVRGAKDLERLWDLGK